MLGGVVDDRRVLLDVCKIWTEALLAERNGRRLGANLVDVEILDAAWALALKEVVFKLALTDRS